VGGVVWWGDVFFFLVRLWGGVGSGGWGGWWLVGLGCISFFGGVGFVLWLVFGFGVVFVCVGGFWCVFRFCGGCKGGVGVWWWG